MGQTIKYSALCMANSESEFLEVNKHVSSFLSLCLWHHGKIIDV
jgi:hypothetical protein